MTDNKIDFLFSFSISMFQIYSNKLSFLSKLENNSIIFIKLYNNTLFYFLIN